MVDSQVELPGDLRRGETVLVSACLMGEDTTWEGGNELCQELVDGLEKAGVVVVPGCPEVLGGLSVPRPPAEPIAGDGVDVLAGDSRIEVVGDGPELGTDVTLEFMRGAESTVALAQEHGAKFVFLAEGSPSCGVERTHSAGALIPGQGLTTAALRAAGIEVIGV